MYKRKDLLGLRGLSDIELTYILDAAAALKPAVDKPEARGYGLDKLSALTMFYEDSTRTRVSFTAAAEYLGMKISDMGVGASSVNKGEGLAATGKNLDAMGINVMILRHRMTGAAHFLARNVRAAVINAGDGVNEHPTQALLDMFTIRERLGRIAGLRVAIIGDIAHSRVARSNAFGLTALGAEVIFAGPPTMLDRDMESLCPGRIRVTHNIREAVEGADVVMGLRIQLERQRSDPPPFPSLGEYARFYGINKDILSLAKPDALIMHPGPVNRGVEMPPDIVDHERSYILEQTKNGVAVRMALLSILTRNAGEGAV